MAKPGPKPKPKPGDRAKTETEQALEKIQTTVSRARRRISPLDRAFITLFADNGYKDAYGCMKTAGWKRVVRPDEVVARLADHIEAERLRRAMLTQMQLDEALIGVAVIARTDGDSKVRLAAYRTIIEVEGALGNKPLSPLTKTDLARQVAEVIERVNGRVGQSPGSRARVRAVLSAAGDAAFEVETSEADPRATAHAEPQPATEAELVPSPTSAPQRAAG